MSIDYYDPASLLTLQLSNASSPVTVQVISAFIPFSMAQVLLVKVSFLNRDLSLSLLQSPGEPFILKIYDPRFYSHRRGKSKETQFPWSSSAEAEAAAKRSASSHEGPDPEFVLADFPDSDDKVGWEEWYYQVSELQYQSEVSSYAVLTSLQGKGIPKYYGSGRLLNLSDRAISPRFILLEYIPDAVRLNAIDLETTHVDLEILRSLVETVHLFGSLGVLHMDLHPKNILFSPGNRPSRAVVIDFGEAGLREEEDDEEWEQIVRLNGEAHWLIRKLAKEFGVACSDLSDLEL